MSILPGNSGHCKYLVLKAIFYPTDSYKEYRYAVSMNFFVTGTVEFMTLSFLSHSNVTTQYPFMNAMQPFSPMNTNSSIDVY